MGSLALHLLVENQLSLHQIKLYMHMLFFVQKCY